MHAALLSVQGSFDKTVRLWDVIQQRESFVLKGHSMSVSDLSWTFDSKLVLTGEFDFMRDQTANIEFSLFLFF